MDCLKQCVQPVVNLEELRGEFGPDMQRLDQDMELRHNFERHQRTPNQIQFSPNEASVIAVVYSMPIATAALPEASWEKSMDIITDPKFSAQKDDLVKHWIMRKQDYSEEAIDELGRKINRHDREKILMKTIRNLNR